MRIGVEAWIQWDMVLTENGDWDTFGRIRLPLIDGIDETKADRLQKAMKRIVTRPNMTINKITPKLHIEKPDVEKMISTEVRRFYDVLREHGADTELARSRWNKTLRGYTVDMVAKLGGADYVIARFAQVTASWALFAGNMSRIVQNFREDEYMAALK